MIVPRCRTLARLLSVSADLVPALIPAPLSPSSQSAAPCHSLRRQIRFPSLPQTLPKRDTTHRSEYRRVAAPPLRRNAASTLTGLSVAGVLDVKPRPSEPSSSQDGALLVDRIVLNQGSSESLCFLSVQRHFCIFKHFVLPKALKPYKKLQECQKVLANLGSEDTVGRPKNYQK